MTDFHDISKNIPATECYPTSVTSINIVATQTYEVGAELLSPKAASIGFEW
jgi:hypothetical protein